MVRETETTNTDILKVINKFSTNVDKRFSDIDQRFDGVDNRLGIIEKEVGKIKATMVTKDYLDDKLADLRGDLVVLMRKEDRKMLTLVEILFKNKIISEKERQHILSLEPFPQLFTSKS